MGIPLEETIKVIRSALKVLHRAEKEELQQQVKHHCKPQARLFTIVATSRAGLFVCRIALVP